MQISRYHMVNMCLSSNSWLNLINRFFSLIVQSSGTFHFCYIRTLTKPICSVDDVGETTTDSPPSASTGSSTPSPSMSNNTGAPPKHKVAFPVPAIIGLAVGVQAILVLAYILYWLRRRHRRLMNKNASVRSRPLEGSHISSSLPTMSQNPLHQIQVSAQAEAGLPAYESVTASQPEILLAKRHTHGIRTTN